MWGMKKALVVLFLLALFLVSGFAILAMPIGQVAGATTSVAAPIGDSNHDWSWYWIGKSPDRCGCRL